MTPARRCSPQPSLPTGSAWAGPATRLVVLAACAALAACAQVGERKAAADPRSGPLALGAAAARGVPPAPVAEVRDVPESFFGTRVADPYRHLENLEAPSTQAWMKAQAERATQVLGRIEGRDALLKAIQRYDGETTPRVGNVARTATGLIAYEKRPVGADQSKLYLRQGLDGAERLLFDPEALTKQSGKPHAMNYYSLSPDGRWVAVGVSAGGSEQASMRFIEVASGRQVGPEIPRVDWGSVSWSPDSRKAYFMRLQEMRPGMPVTEKYQRSAVVAMAPGGDEASIRTIVPGGGGNGAQFPVSEFPMLSVMPDGLVLLKVVNGVAPEASVWHSTLAQVESGDPAWKPLITRADQVRDWAVHGGRVWALTTLNAPRGKIISAPLAGFQAATAETRVAESTRVLLGLAQASDALYLRLRDGNVERLQRLPFTGGAPTDIALPVAGSFQPTGVSPEVPGLLLESQGWVRARQIDQVAPGELQARRTELQPAGPYDAPADVVAEEVLVKSHDGALVPMAIVRKQRTARDGRNPTILYGYASYGMTEEPFFSPSRLAWLDAGGVYAIANPRGSGVFGRDWHLAGQKANKPNTWRDFIACAEYLIAQGWTQPARLGILGGSAGGILVGRAMTERPDLFAAVVPAVGVMDAVRAETTANGVPNIPEFGTRTDEAGFRGLLAMSTYHHIRDGMAYPAVLLTHGVNDPRVNVWHSSKAAAALQKASSSGRPVLLRLDYDAGHGIGNTKSQAQLERADLFAFMLWQMGVPGYGLKP